MMFRSISLGLLCVAIASGLVFKEEPKKNYAYVTMWVRAGKAPAFVRNHAMMSKDEQKAALKVMQEEEGLDDEAAARKYPPKTKLNVDTKYGGEEVAHQGTLKIAQELQNVSSKYPLVILTNDPFLLNIQVNESRKAMYPNVVIKPIEEEDWLKQHCVMADGNGIHYQKLSIFGLTQYDKLLWLDTDVNVRKNLDDLFDKYDTKGGQVVYGQNDDFEQCNGKGDFCSGLMLFTPQEGLIQKLSDTAKSMHQCWGDQRIIRKLFKKAPYEIQLFDHSVVHWGHCRWKKDDSMVVHNQGGPMANRLAGIFR